MTKIIYPTLDGLSELINLSLPIDDIILEDHLGGFDADLNNRYLEVLNQFALDQQKNISTETGYIFDNFLRQKYPCLDFTLQRWSEFETLSNYRIHPDIKHQNFLCSFNGSAHVSRKLLVSILHRFGWFDTTTCSKNFSYDSSVIDGHLKDFVVNESFYRKFFISDHCDVFFGTINSFGHVRYEHANNIRNLEHKLTSSFLHIVSETMATSYYPYFTEKFLYSIVTRGLFLAYAQPGWHDHLEQFFGFRRYDKIFDYRFDEIKNPVQRLVELMSMIAKFSVLSPDDWRDLYEMESETIEYNYEHYFSKNYIKYIEQFF
jgi:hypothetical protein